MPIEVKRVKTSELPQAYYNRGLRQIEDIRVNKVYFVSPNAPTTPVQTLATHVEDDPQTIEFISSSSPLKNLGEGDQVETVMEGHLPSPYQDFPYFLESRVAMLGEDFQMLAMDAAHFDKVTSQVDEWTPPPVFHESSGEGAAAASTAATVVGHGAHDKYSTSGLTPLRVSKARKEAIRDSSKRAGAAKYSREAFNRFAMTRGPSETLEFALAHHTYLDQKELVSGVDDIVRALENLDDPNYIGTELVKQQQQQHRHDTNRIKNKQPGEAHDGEKGEKTLSAKLDLLAAKRKKELLAAGRPPHLSKACSRNYSISRNVGVDSPSRRGKASRLSIGAVPPSDSPSSSASTSPARGKRRLFSPIVDNEADVRITSIREEEEKDNENADSSTAHLSHVNSNYSAEEPTVDVDAIVQRHGLMKEVLPSRKYYSAGPVVVREVSEAVLDYNSPPGVNRVQRDKAVREAIVQEKLRKRGQELGYFVPAYASEPESVQIARKAVRSVMRTREMMEKEMVSTRQQAYDRRTQSALRTYNLHAAVKNAKSTQIRLENESMGEVEDHRYHLPAKLLSWLECSRDMLIVGTAAGEDHAEVDKADQLLKWWNDKGQGDCGDWDVYCKQRVALESERVRDRFINVGLLGSAAVTHSAAATFLTDKQEEQKQQHPGKELVNVLGRANVRETIRLGHSESAHTRSTKPSANMLIAEKIEIFLVHGAGEEERHRNLAEKMAREKKAASRRFSDEAALRELELELRLRGLRRLLSATWLVEMLHELKTYVDGRRVLAAMQQQDKNKGQKKRTDDTEEEVAAMPLGLMKCVLCLARAVQLGFELIAGGTNEQRALLLGLIFECIPANDFKDDIVISVLRHATDLVGISPVVLLRELRVRYGESVEVSKQLRAGFKG
jgi:hypothetical protein